MRKKALMKYVRLLRRQPLWKKLLQEGDIESWFKVSADVFDSDKIKILRADTKIGDSLALMWFFLLALARKKNDGGYVYATEGVAYTPKTLAAVGGFKPKIA